MRAQRPQQRQEFSFVVGQQQQFDQLLWVAQVVGQCRRRQRTFGIAVGTAIAVAGLKGLDELPARGSKHVDPLLRFHRGNRYQSGDDVGVDCSPRVVLGVVFCQSRCGSDTLLARSASDGLPQAIVQAILVGRQELDDDGNFIGFRSQ